MSFKETMTAKELLVAAKKFGAGCSPDALKKYRKLRLVPAADERTVKGRAVTYRAEAIAALWLIRVIRYAGLYPVKFAGRIIKPQTLTGNEKFDSNFICGMAEKFAELYLLSKFQKLPNAWKLGMRLREDCARAQIAALFNALKAMINYAVQNGAKSQVES